MKAEDVGAGQDESLRRAVIATAYNDTRLRRLLSPAEAINVITVGAVQNRTERSMRHRTPL